MFALLISNIRNTFAKVCFLSVILLFFIGFMEQLEAKEKIIQQEEISFEKCLEVISVSANKLSQTPKILDKKGDKRVAIFTLVDGYLTITCDGEKNLVIVTTQQK